MTTEAKIPVDAMIAAARALAAAFGLGDQIEPSAEWPVDSGDSVLAATITGDVEATLFLAVNDEVAARLSTDEERLRRGFDDAAAAIAATIGGAVTVAEVGASQDIPVNRVSISDAGSLTAMFGCTTLADAIAAAEAAAAPSASGPAGFDPVPLVAGTDPVGAMSLGPLTLLQDVEMDVTVELGRTTMPIRELLALQPGMVVEIDRAAGAPIDVLVNGRLIACGEVVVIDEEFGIRITEIISTGGHI